MLKIGDFRGNRRLEKPWKNCIAVGRAYELLRQDLLDQLARAQKEIGFRYCRFHAVFHDDMAVVVRKPDGGLAFQWHHLDKVYDSLLALGLRPFVELNPMPSALASGTQTMFHYAMNVTPPSDYRLWSQLVEAFARHLVERYGMEEVRQWYFEVWNEPNLGGFWSGTKEEYFQLYDASARALKAVDSGLRVGGPASSKANWLTDMIQHCHSSGVPLDFVSTHLYPQDEFVDYHDRQGSPHAPGAFFADTIRSVQNLVRSSAMPRLEIHWTEWNSQSTASTAGITWGDNVYVDNLWAASFIVKNCLALDDAAQTLCWWTVSDLFEEGGMPHSPFSCTYGLMTIHGLRKASYNAFWFLENLRGRVLRVAGSTPERGCFACGEGGVTNLVLWNHYQPTETSPRPWTQTLRVGSRPDTVDGPHLWITARIAEGAGSPWETWCRMGRPQNLSPWEQQLLESHSRPRFEVEPAGELIDQRSLKVTLAPGEVLFVQLRPEGQRALPKGRDEEDWALWDKAMGEQSK